MRFSSVASVGRKVNQKEHDCGQDASGQETA